MNSSVGSPEERRDLIDTEQCVGVESEREKHLAAGEVLLVERRAIGENRLKITVTTPYSVKFIPRNDALVAAAWTGRILPELLESPLDARSSGSVLTSMTPSSISFRNIPPNAG